MDSQVLEERAVYSVESVLAEIDSLGEHTGLLANGLGKQLVTQV